GVAGSHSVVGAWARLQAIVPAISSTSAASHVRRRVCFGTNITLSVVLNGRLAVVLEARRPSLQAAVLAGRAQTGPHRTGRARAGLGSAGVCQDATACESEGGAATRRPSA